MRRVWRIPSVGVALVLLGASAGCRSTGTAAADADDYVVLVQGCSGPFVIGMTPARQGLRDAGVACEIEVNRWHSVRPPFWVIWNDHEYEYVERGAEGLVRQIEGRVRRRPGSRVHVIAQSAGAEVTRRALEMLHPDSRVESVILLGCAFSPDRNLAPALKAVNGKMYNIYSHGDWALLGLGTSLVGAMDRKPASVCAGFTGIRLPAGATEADRTLYEHKLVQIRWDAELFGYGHMGHHVGGLERRFARDYLSHLIAGHGPPGGHVSCGALP